MTPTESKLNELYSGKAEVLPTSRTTIREIDVDPNTDILTVYQKDIHSSKKEIEKQYDLSSCILFRFNKKCVDENYDYADIALRVISLQDIVLVKLIVDRLVEIDGEKYFCLSAHSSRDSLKKGEEIVLNLKELKI